MPPLSGSITQPLLSTPLPRSGSSNHSSGKAPARSMGSSWRPPGSAVALTDGSSTRPARPRRATTPSGLPPRRSTSATTSGLQLCHQGDSLAEIVSAPSGLAETNCAIEFWAMWPPNYG